MKTARVVVARYLDVVVRAALSVDVQDGFDKALCCKKALVLASKVGEQEGSYERSLGGIIGGLLCVWAGCGLCE